MAALNRPPLRPLLRLPAWQYRALHATAAALLLTGVPWLALHYLWGAGAGELPHPLEAWLMRLHGGGAFAALFMAGVLAGTHFGPGWRAAARQHRPSQRCTGLALCVLGAAMVLSGYALYYFTPETWRSAVGWAHTAAGLLAALLLPLHAWRRRGCR